MFPSALQNARIWAATVLIGIRPTAVQNIIRKAI
jgi:hypothetical protein